MILTVKSPRNAVFPVKQVEGQRVMERQERKPLTPLDRGLWTLLITTTIVYVGFAASGTLIERFYPGSTMHTWALGCSAPFLGIGLLIMIPLIFFKGAPGESLVEKHPIRAGVEIAVILALVIVLPLVAVAAGIVRI